jgi:hypothetical protein
MIPIRSGLAYAESTFVSGPLTGTLVGVLAALATIATGANNAYSAHRLDELLPWNWAPKASAMALAAA